MKQIFLAVFSVLFLLQGCAMFSSWKSIPAPGGCDQCHTVAISTNWQVSYQPVVLSDGRGREYFQTHEHYLAEREKQSAPLEAKKVGELQCFDCHKSPTPAHRERKGRFHH
jgi:hypothetical protein